MRKLSAIIALALTPFTVHAGNPTSLIASGIPECDFTTGRLHAGCVPNFLEHVLRFVFGLTGGVFLIMILIAGYQVAFAKVLGRDRSEGFTRLRVAIIGFILCGLSWQILDFIIEVIAGP